MKYVILINEDESAYAVPNGDQVVAEVIEGHNKFSAAMAEKGVEFSGERLKEAHTATTLHYKNGGEPVVRDGAFAETHEELGGFYIIDVANLDEAIEWAKMIPIPGNGAVEVRPVWPMDEY
ncbi:YciI family protein [Sphingomicrobium sediminis]|uniref:YciI family protein n=1 Tax=Sphingomicrobium sediminis TaxID=2950949 RepID=A0A9X2J1Y2_9SPHN|nr:YciI family protein [Sphingomicrobium sediminis]MCM8557723.1 YciI family protein [Sphingomicrobium sediminis]